MIKRRGFLSCDWRGAIHGAVKINIFVKRVEMGFMRRLCIASKGSTNKPPNSTSAPASHFKLQFLLVITAINTAAKPFYAP